MSVEQSGPDDVAGVTIKSGGGYEAPWFTPRGTPTQAVRQIKEFFGLTDEEVEGKAPFEVQILASVKYQLAWASALVENELGGKPAGGYGGAKSNGRLGNGNRPDVRPGQGGGFGQRAQEKEEPDVNGGVLEAIEKAATLQDTQKLYARHAKLFEAEQKAGKETPLKDALKARITALKNTSK